MVERDEKSRILTMLEEGKITAEEASSLLRALTYEPCSRPGIDGAFDRLFSAFGRRVRTGDGPVRTDRSSGKLGTGPVTVKLSSINGRIVIGATDGDEYRLEIQYPQDEETPPYTVVADEASLAVTSDRDTVGASSVRIRLDLPADRRYELEAELVNGRISARDLTCGQLGLSVGNGRIEARDCRCERADLRARNGSVTADLGAEQLKASSNTGRVRLVPDPRVSGRYQLTTGVGSVEVLLKKRAGTGYRVNCTSELGKVRVRLPEIREQRQGMGSDVTVKTSGFEESSTRIEIDAASRVGKIDVDTAEGGERDG